MLQRVRCRLACRPCEALLRSAWRDHSVAARCAVLRPGAASLSLRYFLPSSSHRARAHADTAQLLHSPHAVVLADDFSSREHAWGISDDFWPLNLPCAHERRAAGSPPLATFYGHLITTAAACCTGRTAPAQACCTLKNQPRLPRKAAKTLPPPLPWAQAAQSWQRLNNAMQPRKARRVLRKLTVLVGRRTRRRRSSSRRLERRALQRLSGCGLFHQA